MGGRKKQSLLLEKGGRGENLSGGTISSGWGGPKFGEIQVQPTSRPAGGERVFSSVVKKKKKNNLRIGREEEKIDRGITNRHARQAEREEEWHRKNIGDLMPMGGGDFLLKGTSWGKRKV